LTVFTGEFDWTGLVVGWMGEADETDETDETDDVETVPVSARMKCERSFD